VAVNKPRICVSIAASEVAQATETVRSIEQYDPDLIELRIDYLKTSEGLKTLRDITDFPLIATNRRRDQGGLFYGSEEKRVATLLNACEAGFDYVDLELTTQSLESVAEEVRKQGAKLIISFHDSHGRPSKQALKRILEEEMIFEPDVCKIVCAAETYLDNLAYLSFLLDNPGIELVCFGTGKLGIISRVLSPLFGGTFTYASAGAGLESAPGQPIIGSLREVYRLLGV